MRITAASSRGAGRELAFDNKKATMEMREVK
jgi:hypothetical protein